MPLFCIIGFDAEGSAEKREKFVDPHLDALKKMNRAGKLFSAGPLMSSTNDNAEYCGSLLIIEAKDQKEAEAWFYQEPYYMAGVYAEVTIKPYIDAMSFCQ
jgi:uncharacterized protein YciI